MRAVALAKPDPRARCPLCERLLADDIEGVFVRALARAERPEDRRLELVLLDRHGRRQSLLRGLDNPAALSWIATHIERALGFSDFSE